MNNLVKQSKTLNIVIFCMLFFSFNTTIDAQTSDKQQERVYIKIEVKGMACAYCVFGMEKKLKEISGVNNVEIELEEGLAYISTPIDQKPIKESLELIIKNAGFTVGNIDYSNKPFISKKPKEKS